MPRPRLSRNGSASSGSLFSVSPRNDSLADSVGTRHMLTLVGPSSSVHWTSLSPSSIPPLRDYLSTRPSSTKANLHTEPILTLLPTLSPPVDPSRVCLLDPRATEVLAPEDADKFDVFLYGGILGDDPPRDRTGDFASWDSPEDISVRCR